MSAKKYRVFGYCYVPTEATAIVEANNPQEAITKAKQLFYAKPSNLIDSQSGDETSAFAWEPTAEETP